MENPQMELATYGPTNDHTLGGVATHIHCGQIQWRLTSVTLIMDKGS